MQSFGLPSGLVTTWSPSQVEATTHFRDPEILARVSGGLGDPMSGLAAAGIPAEELLETRGW